MADLFQTATPCINAGIAVLFMFSLLQVYSEQVYSSSP